MEHIDAVCAVDRHPSSARDKTHDLIPGYRVAALGEAHGHIVDSFDHDTALGFCDMHLLAVRLRDLLEDRFICDLFFMLLFIFLKEAVHHLPLLQAAVPDRSQHGVPVAESVLFLHDLHILRS